MKYSRARVVIIFNVISLEQRVSEVGFGSCDVTGFSCNSGEGNSGGCAAVNGNLNNSCARE